MDYEIAAQFLSVLDPLCDLHRFVAIHDQDGAAHGVPMFGRLADMWPHICELNATGYGIFVNVNRMRDAGGKTSDVARVRAVWRDNDAGSVKPLPIEPHIVVQSSPGRSHEYWLADVGADDHARILRGIVQNLDGDRNALGLARVLRLPGTLHMKRAPHLVTAQFGLGAIAVGAYSAPELEAAFGPLPTMAPSLDAPMPTDRPSDDTIRAALACIPADDRETWRNVGMALHDAYGGGDDGLAMFDAWSQTSVKYGGVEKAWASFRRGGGITLGTLFKTARDYGFAGETTDSATGIDAVPSAGALAFGSHVFRARDNRDVLYTPHKWVAESYALRKTLSLIVAQPGVGKSTLALQLAVCVALGDGSRYGLDVKEKCRVLIISAEDAREFVEPRVAGVIEHMRGHAWDDAALDAARDDVHIYAEPFLAVARSGKGLSKTQIVEELKGYIDAHNIGLFILDPLVETHEANENDNAEVRFVSAVFRAVAVATGAAGLIVHHGRKVSTADSVAGDLSVARGGGSLGGAVRAAVTLTTMTSKEATELGVAEADRRSYFRADGAKNSHGRVIGAAWYRKESVALTGGLETPVCVPVDLTPVKTHDAQRQLLAVVDLIPETAENAIAVNALVKTWLNDARGRHLTVRKARDTILAALADEQLAADTHTVYLRRSDAGAGGRVWRERIQLTAAVA